jgi:hypothetical protein
MNRKTLNKVMRFAALICLIAALPLCFINTTLANFSCSLGFSIFVGATFFGGD